MRKIMIKVGSGVVVRSNGAVHHEAIAHISKKINRLVEGGNQVAITTSGFAAAGSGDGKEGYRIGGDRVVAAWQQHLGMQAGTLHLIGRATLLDAAKEMQGELDTGKTPLANGHWGDHCFGGNDHLAVELARKLDMHAVIFLGSMPGVCRNVDDPGSVIRRIDPTEVDAYRQFAGPTSHTGTGGIEARLDAARQADYYGITSHVGHWQDNLDDLLAGSVGTSFIRAEQASGVVTWKQ